MSEEVSKKSHYLESVPNVKHKNFNLNDDQFKLKCFYCGHYFGATSIDMRIGDVEAEDPNDDLVHVMLSCGKAFGGCNYSFGVAYPRQMSDSIDKVKAWADWFAGEQKACEAKGLVPKWLKGEYEREAKTEGETWGDLQAF